MTLLEAYQECRKGNFVSHISFDEKQSMHEYNHTLYYEDGANLSAGDFDLYTEEWAKEGWYVKYTKEQVDREKLKKMHNENKNYMLQSGSYEDCIIK